MANWFIQKFDEHEKPITQLQLNKLVYLAHGWHLAIGDEVGGLISEQIVAWKYGPIVPSLRSEFREFGSNPIDRLADEDLGYDSYIPTLEAHAARQWEYSVLDFVFRRYGDLSGPALIELTHRPDSPWTIVTKGGTELGFNKVIPDELIRQHFQQLIANV